MEGGNEMNMWLMWLGGFLCGAGLTGVLISVLLPVCA